jgi:DNA-binding NtrC family response regulator
LRRYFSQLYSNKYFKPYLEFDKKAIDTLVTYHYPGNVRELQYTIERAVIMAEGDVLHSGDIIFSPPRVAPGRRDGTR